MSCFAYLHNKIMRQNFRKNSVEFVEQPRRVNTFSFFCIFYRIDRNHLRIAVWKRFKCL